MWSRVLLVALTVTLSASPAFAQGGGAWPMFRGDASHLGRSTSSGPVLPSLQWRFDVAAPAYASPAVGPDGTIYAASTETLHALAPDGAERWRLELGGFTVASPAVNTDGTVFVGSRDETLLAVETRTGTIRWTFVTDGEIWASPLIGATGTVYVATSTGTVHALDPTSGAQRWSHDGGSRIISTPALYDGHLYVIDYDGTVRVLDAVTGTLEHSFSLPTEVVSSPTVGTDGTLYVGGLDGTMYAANPFVGDVRWTSSVGDEIVSSPALANDGTLYVGTVGGQLHALSSSDGQRRWSTLLGASIFSSPALDAAGRVYVGAADTTAVTGELYALDAADGAVQWTFGTSGPVWSSPALDADGVLHAASVGSEHTLGQLYRIESTVLRVEVDDEPVAETDHEVGVAAAPGFNATSGTLFYRQGGARDYSSVPLVPGDQPLSFVASIPGSAVTLRGLEYYVSMSDGEAPVTLPTTHPDQHPLVERVRVNQMEVPRELPVRGFSMISVPAELAQPTVDDVLVADYGPAGVATWRLFRWIDGSYREFPSVTDVFEPGVAFFLVHRSGTRFSIEDARSVDTAVPYVVTLEPGWNQIGMPFSFPIDRNDVVVRNAPADAVDGVAFYDGEQMLQDLSAFNPLQPWHGYFFHNALSQDVQLAFLPVEATPAASSASPAASRIAGEDDNYVMRLSARSVSGALLDTQNWLGLSQDAHVGPDASDRVEAPPLGNYLRLSLVEDDVRYAVNYKPEGHDGQRWHLELERSPKLDEADWVEVILHEKGQRPAGYELHVVDEDAGETIGVVDGRFRVKVGSGDGVRHLSLLLGTPAYTAEALEGVREHPASFFLDQNAPNPFSGTTTIPFSLEEPAHVTLEVFNVMGQHVATLIDRDHDAGHHTLTWDGRTSSGLPLASGLYLYRLRTDSRVATRTMLLLH